MKTPVLIVIIASVVVLCVLPALYIFLAYHTYRERQRWKVDHDIAVEKMEAEASATSYRLYSSSGQGRAPPAVHYHNHNHRQQPPAPLRPAPNHNSWAPPPPPRELDVFKSSRDHLSSHAAPRAAHARLKDDDEEQRGRQEQRKLREAAAAADTIVVSSRGGVRRNQPGDAAVSACLSIAAPYPMAARISILGGRSVGRPNMAPSEEQPGAVAAAKEQAGKDSHPGNENLAQKLLKPRRRAQIEIWLNEITTRWEMQRCAAGRSFGHHSDLLTPPATGQPGETPRSAAVEADACTCPVCGRPLEDGKPVVAQPERRDQQSSSGKSGKGKNMFHGIRTAMSQFKARDGGRSGDKHEDERWDRAMSTQMFLAEGSEVGSSIGSSTGPFDGAQNKVLEERMARLMRAQKLLERSQARPGGDEARHMDIATLEND